MSAFDDYKQKKEVFEHGYQEVLAALKHQDDKLNRTLTALAFLTVAGVSLYLKLSGPGLDAFGGAGPGAAVILFVVFLIAIALGVIITLTAIGPGRPLPNARSSGAHAELPQSLLFYALISRDETWDEKLDLSPEELTQELATDFHGEARSIARRVDYKVARAREANAWVQLAIVALSLMGIFSATGLSLSSRWWIVSGLLIVVLSLPFWDLWLMRDTQYVTGDFSKAAYWILLAIVGLSATFLVVGDLTDSQWQALGYAAVAFVLPRYAIVQSKAALPLMIAALAASVPTLLLTIF
jgi:hypothetical protein